jgi:2-oxoglutarate ferredoxin oxidoreductase subunit beta
MEETKLMEKKVHPLEEYFRKERLPHIWCSGCGLGIAMTSFLYAIKELKIPKEKVAVVSGIGCSGRVAGYVKMDSYHTTHGRPIAFATGLKLAKPDLYVVVFSGDGDIAAIGGNHLIHAARRNMDLTVICVNNFNYGMTGGQFGPTTPLEAITTTTPYGNFEYPFNLPHLAYSSGATFVARWTVLHAYQLRQSIKKALLRKGFNFIEVISPCPTGFGRPNKIGEAIDEMRYYKENSIIRNGIDPKEAELSFRGKIVVGEFVEEERPSFLEIYQKFLKEKGVEK